MVERGRSTYIPTLSMLRYNINKKYIQRSTKLVQEQNPVVDGSNVRFTNLVVYVHFLVILKPFESEYKKGNSIG